MRPCQGWRSPTPSELCGSQPVQFVRPCWYRAFVDNRPAGIVPDAPEYFDVLCKGLAGLQREACVTAVSVIGLADPAEQLAVCAQLQGPGDAASCVRGTKVQNLLGAPIDEFVRLIGHCELLSGTARGACYRWLGKTITVITDGTFARLGCPNLTGAARMECAAGARSADDALVTFQLAGLDDVVVLIGRRRRAEPRVHDIEPVAGTIDRRRDVEVRIGDRTDERCLREVV